MEIWKHLNKLFEIGLNISVHIEWDWNSLYRVKIFSKIDKYFLFQSYLILILEFIDFQSILSQELWKSHWKSKISVIWIQIIPSKLALIWTRMHEEISNLEFKSFRYISVFSTYQMSLAFFCPLITGFERFYKRLQAVHSSKVSTNSIKLLKLKIVYLPPISTNVTFERQMWKNEKNILLQRYVQRNYLSDSSP